MADKRNPLIPESPTAQTYSVDEDQGDVFTSDDPIALFEAWFALAREKEINDANAMALATVDANAMPDVRMVLLKDISAQGLSFYTHTTSAKGSDMAQTHVAALCFHWKSIRRQVRFRGAIEAVSDEQADAYFATRARGAQIGAYVSKQSQPLKSREVLEQAIAQAERDFEGREIERPEHWSGYILKPTRIEFWVNRPYRLHDRLQFWRENPDEDWQSGQLYP